MDFAKKGGVVFPICTICFPFHAIKNKIVWKRLFTRFGGGNTTISKEIDIQNEFGKTYCEQNGITFVNITGITRQALTNTNLVASDGLHPSALAYTKFVERILPLSVEKLKN